MIQVTVYVVSSWYMYLSFTVQMDSFVLKIKLYAMQHRAPLDSWDKGTKVVFFFVILPGR